MLLVKGHFEVLKVGSKVFAWLGLTAFWHWPLNQRVAGKVRPLVATGILPQTFLGKPSSSDQRQCTQIGRNFKLFLKVALPFSLSLRSCLALWFCSLVRGGQLPASSVSFFFIFISPIHYSVSFLTSQAWLLPGRGWGRWRGRDWRFRTEKTAHRKPLGFLSSHGRLSWRSLISSDKLPGWVRWLQTC